MYKIGCEGDVILVEVCVCVYDRTEKTKQN
jgi:hypothetical protein